MDAHELASDDLRCELEDAFIMNDISSERLRKLVTKATSCGVLHLSKMDHIARTSSKKKMKNAFLQHISKKKMWVPLYYAKVPLNDGKDHSIPFILPHVLMHQIQKRSVSLDTLKPKPQDTEFVCHIQHTGRELGVDWTSALPLGLHGDGTPYGRQKKDSLEVFSMNFPCWTEQMKLRIPLCVVNKKHIEKDTTIRRVLEVLSWSFKCLALGKVIDFEGNGHTKNCPVGTVLPVCFIVQLRADWAFLKQVYGLPQFNEKRGICHMCSADPGNWQQVGLDAPWRQQRLSAEMFHKKQLGHGANPCPIFTIPGVSVKLVHLDWLHCADAGVACDIAGNIFLSVLPFLDKSRPAAIEKLWEELNAWYKSQQISEKIDKLRKEHFLQDKKPPKLKCKAAACRHLVPFLKHLCEKVFDESDRRVTEYHKTIKALAQSLHATYQILNNWSSIELATKCRETCLLMKSLEDHAQQKCPGTLNWKLKPKVHIWQELCEYQSISKGNPNAAWCYKDEDFGGFLQRIGERRGGRNTAKTIAENIFHRFFACKQFPLVSHSSHPRLCTD